MNQVQIIGTVGKDAEIKQVANGEMALFTVATTERYKDKAGENKEITEWHNIVSFTPHIISKSKNAKKGDLVFLAGKLKYSKYTDKNGVERIITQIHPDTLELCFKQKNNQTANTENFDLPF